jgi:hypothetical protein
LLIIDYQIVETILTGDIFQELEIKSSKNSPQWDKVEGIKKKYFSMHYFFTI